MIKGIHLWLFAALLFSCVCKAQNFEWASTTRNSDMRILFATKSANNSITVAAYTEEMNRSGPQTISQSDLVMTSAIIGGVQDNSIPVSEGNHYLINYSSTGRINWCTPIIAEIDGITSGNDGYIYVLCYNKMLGLASRPFFITVLDIHGNIIKTRTCDFGTRVKVDAWGITAHPNGNLIINGYIPQGKLCDSMNVSAGKGGGDFIIMMDTAGKSVWANIFQKSENSQSGSRPTNVAISTIGDIYISGYFEEEITFGGKVRKVAQKEYNPRPRSMSGECYVTSYSAAGKLKWVVTSGCDVIPYCLAALDDVVILGYNTINAANCFNRNIDTTSHKYSVISYFDSKTGIVKSSLSLGLDPARSMDRYGKDSVVVFTTKNQVSGGIYSGKKGIIGNDTLTNNNENSIVFATGPSGKILWVKRQILPLISNNDPLTILTDKGNNILICGTFFVGFKSKLDRYDKAFLQGEGTGSMPFVGMLAKDRAEVIQHHK